VRPPEEHKPLVIPLILANDWKGQGQGQVKLKLEASSTITSSTLPLHEAESTINTSSKAKSAAANSTKWGLQVKEKSSQVVENIGASQVLHDASGKTDELSIDELAVQSVLNGNDT
jgi:hypothetical protein